ncbi:MAG: lysine--tRNA ligase [SAR202 cluster bacterium Io17-Chloro-G9]|nr:MAG: lysine--tRNA ligase [SAR202 cluster bacterium Io17-Chloro-G9]
MPDREEGQLASRNVKLDRLRQNGIDPYPPRFKRTCDAATAIAQFEALEALEGEGAPESPSETAPEEISLAGRIMSIRGMGRASFVDLQDASGVVQALLRENVLGEAYGLLQNLDVGDHLGVTGPMMRTRTGQATIEAHHLVLTAKGMHPLPEKFHGLRDVETRYRQRYLDLIANPDVMPVFAQRSKIITSIRNFLDSRGFMEVDTPVLVPVAAGANARPFTTHHNALDQQLYLRIATELYLKRLIVGGFDKVYELGRVFRNEGVDQDHNPEFTLLESYEAYADYNDVMHMVEEMVSSVALEVRGAMQIPYGQEVIDFTPPWRKVSLQQELYQHSGIDIDAFPEDAALARRAVEAGVEVASQEGRGRLIDKLISTFVEPKLIQPTFLLDYPEIMSPLAKAKPGATGYVERFEAFAAGMEIANSYTELNDPEVQRARFDAQEEVRRRYQDEEVDRKDEDFLLAMEYGMPPTGGLGMGIDRLVMLLTSQPSIRDVVLFPQMRRLDSQTDQPKDQPTKNEDAAQ